MKISFRVPQRIRRAFKNLHMIRLGVLCVVIAYVVFLVLFLNRFVVNPIINPNDLDASQVLAHQEKINQKLLESIQQYDQAKISPTAAEDWPDPF